MYIIRFILLTILSANVYAQESWMPYPILDGINVYFPETPSIHKVDSVDTDVISYATAQEMFLVTVTDIDFTKELDSAYYMQILQKYIQDMAHGNLLLNNVEDHYKSLLCRYFKIKTFENLQNPLTTENIIFIYKGKAVCLSYWDISKATENTLRAKAFFEKTNIEPVASLDEQSDLHTSEERINSLPDVKNKWWDKLPWIVLLIALIVIFVRLYKKSQHN